MEPAPHRQEPAAVPSRFYMIDKENTMNRNSMKGFVLAAALSALASQALAAAVKGSVTDDKGQPMSGVQVTIPALQRATVTGADGAFSFDVPAGDYVLQFRRADYGSELRTVKVTGAGASVAAVSLSQTAIEAAPITISAAPQPSSSLTSPATVTVLEGRKLDKARGQSPMEAIKDEPGVHLISDGPSTSKAVIRGLSGQDIVIVEDGVRSESLQWGNEHGPETDTLGTSRIEVLRGPNSLLYGSDALGGVISVSHPELPNAKLGDGALQGKAVAEAHSVNNSFAQGLLLSGAQGDWGWRTNFSQRQAGNYHTPGEGSIPNTGSHEVNGDGSFGVRKDWGGVAFDFGRLTKRLEFQAVDAPGFPDTPLADLEYQVLQHDKGSIRANVITAPARIEVVAGFDRVNRSEFDSPAAPDSLATLHWIQTNYTADIKAHHAPLGPLQGTIGLSGVRRVEQSIGVKHLTPGYNQASFGEYVYEELPLGDFTFSAGVRADQTRFNVGQDDLIGADTVPTPVAKRTLDYSSITGALGAVYRVTGNLAFAVNGGRGYRNPVPFELFAFGEHEGEHVFSIGNPGLKPETSLNTDASLRWSSPRVKAEIGVFRNYVHNYIYGTYLDPAAQDPAVQALGIPVVMTAQTNATIQGFDFGASGAPLDWLTLNLNGSLVRGYNDNYADKTLPNHNIPHVPADNMKVGFEIHRQTLGGLRNPYAGVDAKLTRAQRRTGPEDLATPGYGLLGLRAGTEVLANGSRVALDAGVDNLLNKGYIDYNSLLKFSNIQAPGRNVYVKVSVPFGS
jgi:iron complex outermembrane receptor protein